MTLMKTASSVAGPPKTFFELNSVTITNKYKNATFISITHFFVVLRLFKIKSASLLSVFCILRHFEAGFWVVTPRIQNQREILHKSKYFENYKSSNLEMLRNEKEKKCNFLCYFP